MARKSASKGKASKASEGNKNGASATTETKNLKIIPSYPSPFPSFYANYASVNHTTSEIFIDCALLAPPYNVDLEDAEILAPVIVRLTLPPPVARGLITALQAQVEKQKQTQSTGTLAVALPKSKGDKGA